MLYFALCSVLVAATPGVSAADLPSWLLAAWPQPQDSNRRRLQKHTDVVCRDPCAGWAIQCVMTHDAAPDKLEEEIKTCTRQIWDVNGECSKCVKKQDKKKKIVPSCGYANGVEYVGYECDENGEKYCVWGKCLNEGKEPEETPAPTRAPEDCSDLIDKIACKNFGCFWGNEGCSADEPGPALKVPEVTMKISAYRNERACENLDAERMFDNVIEVKAGLDGHCHNIGDGNGSVKLTCGEKSSSIKAEFYRYPDCVGYPSEEPLLTPNLCYASKDKEGKVIFKHTKFTPPAKCVSGEGGEGNEGEGEGGDGNGNGVQLPKPPCFESFKALAETKSKEDCAGFGGKLNKKKGTCTLKNAKKVKCKKLTDESICELLDCKVKKGRKGLRCSGKPQFKKEC